MKEYKKPWGSYIELYRDKNFLLKILNISPGKKISLQKHKKRSEHWTVVEGEASILLGKKNISLSVNDSIFVPKEEVHRISNSTQDPLKIIEIQSGEYDENDIIRLDDMFGRA